MTLLQDRDAEARRAAALPDTYGENFYRTDQSLRSVLPLYLEAGLLQFLEPHLDWLGANITKRLDALAATADKSVGAPPSLAAGYHGRADREALRPTSNSKGSLSVNWALPRCPTGPACWAGTAKCRRRRSTL